MVADQEDQKVEEWDHLLTAAAVMVDALAYYLIEGNVFRTVMARQEEGFERITMSIGELLALLHKLQAQRSRATPAQQSQLDAMRTTVQRTCHQLHDLFHDMVVREIMARLDSLNWFLHDCENGKDACRLQFPTEIQNRQRIEELVKVLDESMVEDVTERVQRIDQRLRRITYKSDFVWPTAVKEIYPEEPYWYLYSLPD
ncbi:MAG: hypothetical protein R3E79_54630 [Caldilineaceae bacterium]